MQEQNINIRKEIDLATKAYCLKDKTSYCSMLGIKVSIAFIAKDKGCVDTTVLPINTDVIQKKPSSYSDFKLYASVAYSYEHTPISIQTIKDNKIVCIFDFVITFNQ